MFGDSFHEFTRMASVNAHGGLLALAARVRKGQAILVVNSKTAEEQECHIVHLGPVQEGKWIVGIEFAHPAANFWKIHFPPIIPRRPLSAKELGKTPSRPEIRSGGQRSQLLRGLPARRFVHSWFSGLTRLSAVSCPVLRLAKLMWFSLAAWHPFANSDKKI